MTADGASVAAESSVSPSSSSSSSWLPPILVVGASALFFFALRRFAQRKRTKLSLNDSKLAKTGHRWLTFTAAEPGSVYCNRCASGVLEGFECAFCTAKADCTRCAYEMSLEVACKAQQRIEEDEEGDGTTVATLQHYWVRGNIPYPSASCTVCSEPVGAGVGLRDLRCIWCNLTAHDRCRERVDAHCTRGDLAAALLPPKLVDTRKAGSRHQKHLIIDRVYPPRDVEGFTPIVVLVNSSSGSGAGGELMHRLQALLHPVQVVDVLKSNVPAVLRWCADDSRTDPKTCNPRVLIAGGDGTVSLVLNDIDDLGERRPPAAIFPLGTGNDLSRMLGWGEQADAVDVDCRELLKQVTRAVPVDIDRWRVHITSPRRLGVMPVSRLVSMTNYVSIGVDACVTFGMQSTRSSLVPSSLSSRFLNKLLFFTFGTKDVFEHACANLQNKLELEVDGTKIDLPEIEGLCFLNISYWGAGVEVWGKDTEPRQDPSDGLFEVFAVRSSFHIAQLQVGLSEPIRLAQGRRAVLKMKQGPLPMQSDGEAWMQPAPATLTVEHRGKSRLLIKRRERT